MKTRNLLAGSTALAVVAFSAAALAPVASHAATSAPQVKPGAACTVDGSNTQGTLTAPVIKSASLANDPNNPAYAQTLGYHVATTPYPSSAALELTVSFTSAGCGSLSIVTYGIQNQVVGSTPLQSRTASLTGLSSPVTLHSLIAEVPPGNDSNANGPCLGTQLEVRDTSGKLVQVAPTGGPLSACPGGGGGFTFGG